LAWVAICFGRQKALLHEFAAATLASQHLPRRLVISFLDLDQALQEPQPGRPASNKVNETAGSH
jgi:hypothetical protein